MGEAKSRIGKAAAALVNDGEAVVLDSGTTTLYVARYLRLRSNLTVLTSSLAVVEKLGGSARIRLQLIGRIYRSSSHDLVGAAVSDSLARVHANKVFFGAAALSFRKGVMVYDLEEPRTLLESAAERILVVDSSKIGKKLCMSFVRFGTVISLSQIAESNRSPAPIEEAGARSDRPDALMGK